MLASMISGYPRRLIVANDTNYAVYHSIKVTLMAG